MKLVAGLGNPGAKYRGTRHNVGFEVVDLLAARHGLAYEAAPADALQARWRRTAGLQGGPAVSAGVQGAPAVSDVEVVLLVKPLTFMNVSGVAVSELTRYYKMTVADTLVVCDDVNLPLGRLRVRASGTEGGHNGLRSIAEQFGTVDYARLRIGVGRGDTRRDLADHVLARFEPDEQPGMESAIARAADAVECWLLDGLAKTMNSFNRE